MRMLRLCPSERHALKKQIRETQDAKILRRAQAVLWYDQEIEVTEIAKRLETNRQNIYNWINTYIKRKKQSKKLVNRLEDHKSPGRPPKKTDKIKDTLVQIIEESPRDYGYRHTTWTVSLLAKHFEKTKRMKISQDTVRRCLKNMNYAYKRPRRTLSKKSLSWRQSKGG